MKRAVDRRGTIGELLVWLLVGLSMLWVLAVSWGTVNSRPVWMDEAASWQSATENSFGSLVVNGDDDSRHPSLSFIVIKAVLGVTGGGEAGSVELLWLRAGALGAGVLAVGMAGLLGRVALGRFGAVGCAVLAANDPVLLAQSQQARMFSLLMLGQTLAMACAVVVLRGGVWGGVLGRLRLLAALGCGLGLTVAFNAVYLGLVVFGAVALAGVWAVLWAWWRGREVAGGAGGVTLEVGVVAGVGTLGSIGSLWFLAAFTMTGSKHDEGSGMSWETVRDTGSAMMGVYGSGWVSAVTVGVALVGVGCWWVRGSGLNPGVGRAVAVMVLGVAVLSVLMPFRVRATSHGFVYSRFFSAVGPWVWLGVTTAVWVGVHGLVLRVRSGGVTRRRRMAVGLVGAVMVLGLAGLWRVSWKGVEWELALNYRIGAVVEALRESGVRPGDRYEIVPPVTFPLLDYGGLPKLTERPRDDADVVLGVDATGPSEGGAWYLVLEHLGPAEEVAEARARLAAMYREWWGSGLPGVAAEHVRQDLLGVYRLDGDGAVWFGGLVREGRGWGLVWERVYPVEGE